MKRSAEFARGLEGSHKIWVAPGTRAGAPMNLKEDQMKKSGLEVQCCWCRKIMDTTESVLVQGVFHVHRGCAYDFIAKNDKDGFLPPRPVPKIGFSTGKGDSVFVSVNTGLIFSRRQIAFVWKGKYVFNLKFGGSIEAPALSFESDSKPKDDRGGAVDYVGKPGEGQ